MVMNVGRYAERPARVAASLAGEARAMEIVFGKGLRHPGSQPRAAQV